MQSRLVLAVSISVLIIGIAAWYRFGAPVQVNREIVAVETPNMTEEDYNEILKTFTASSTEGSPAPAEPLSNTDILGRQMIMDYVGLAASGQANDATVANLADQYAAEIPTLINKAATINYSNLKVVTNTKANFQNYADKITQIHKDYASSIMSAYGNNRLLSTLNPQLYAMTNVYSVAYASAAHQLENLPVPSALAADHLQLINSYLSSSVAMQAISKAEEDSASAFAGLILLKNNLDREDAILSDITKILTANGI